MSLEFKVSSANLYVNVGFFSKSKDLCQFTFPTVYVLQQSTKDEMDTQSQEEEASISTILDFLCMVHYTSVNSHCALHNGTNEVDPWLLLFWPLRSFKNSLVCNF